MPAAAESPEQFDLALGDAHLGVDQARPVGDQTALAVEQLEGIEGAGAIVAARQPVGVALLVEGMTCPACAWVIERALDALMQTGRLTVDHIDCVAALLARFHRGCEPVVPVFMWM